MAIKGGCHARNPVDLFSECMCGTCARMRDHSRKPHTTESTGNENDYINGMCGCTDCQSAKTQVVRRVRAGPLPPDSTLRTSDGAFNKYSVLVDSSVMLALSFFLDLNFFERFGEFVPSNH